jgi:hypothetical protein
VVTELVVGVIGTLGGGVISLLASLLTLRSTHRSERDRWLADRDWEHATDLAPRAAGCLRPISLHSERDDSFRCGYPGLAQAPDGATPDAGRASAGIPGTTGGVCVRPALGKLDPASAHC